MEYSNFIKLGFNKNEAKVYLKLLEFGKSDAKQLIKETGFHKNIVYDNLNKLIEKGVVSYINEENKKLFVAESADSLLDIIEKKQKKLDEEAKLTLELTKEIKRMPHKKPVDQEATIFKGISGIKRFFNILLKENLDYFGFGGSKESVEIMGETYWHNFHVKQKALGFKGKLLFNDSLRGWGKKMADAPIEVKFTETKFESLTETMAWGETAVILVWSEVPLAILIRDKYVAESYKRFFQLLWKHSKK
jgi:predicted transcriptional regulator